jgi:hypothetical protein
MHRPRSALVPALAAALIAPLAAQQRTLVVDAAAGPFFDRPAAVAASRPGDRIEIHRAPTPYSATTISHGLDLDTAAGSQVAALTIQNLAAIHAVRVEGLAVVGGSIGFATYSVGARFVFLTNADRLSPTQTNTLDVQHRMSLRTVRAWSFKEAAADIWRYVRRSAAESAWLDWARAAMRSRLDRSSVSPVWSASICRASSTAWPCAPPTLSPGRSTLASRRSKAAACGFRSPTRLRNAILFHLGGLDLYPAHVSATHTTS